MLGESDMKDMFLKWMSALTILFVLGACGSVSENSSADAPENSEGKVEVNVQGLSDHYHTGDAVQLTAAVEGEVEYDQWQWYIRKDEASEWEAVANQESTEFTGEAKVDGQEIKVVLLDENQNAYAESQPLIIAIDDHGHSHAHDEESQKIYEGYFEDDQIKDRSISDWQGDWQSVYPYLQSGELDEVFAHKAEHDGSMTEEEYKNYYEVGYETDVDRIVIEDDTFTFYKNNEEHTAHYTYDGYEVLTYEKGNRGVRYIFAKGEDESSEMPQYIQFSDHGISPTDAYHFHLYWGDDREALLSEVTNWPTYYPTDMDADEVVHEMIAH